MKQIRLSIRVDSILLPLFMYLVLRQRRMIVEESLSLLVGRYGVRESFALGQVFVSANTPPGE